MESSRGDDGTAAPSDAKKVPSWDSAGARGTSGQVLRWQ